jgi:excisionase family DNA binding protein
MTNPAQPPASGTPRVLLTVEQAAERLNLGRTTTYALIKTGQLGSVKVGRLRRIPVAAITAYTARLTTEQDSA